MTNGYYGKIDPMPVLPIGQGESISALGGASNPIANAVYSQTVLGASDSAATPTPTAGSGSLTPSDEPATTPDVSPTAEQTVTQTPTTAPSVSPAPTSAAETPTPTPLPSVFANPAAPDNTNFTVLDKQIKLNEQIANAALTQKVKILTWNVKLKKGEI